MNLDPDDVAVFLDSWGIRRLFSLAVRRRGCPRKSRDPILDEFFQTLEGYWGKTVSQGRNKAEDRKAQEVQQMPEEEEVNPELLSDTEMSDIFHFHFMRAETDDYESMLTPEKLREAPVDGNEVEAAKCKDPSPKRSLTQELEDMCDVDLDLEEQLLMEKLALLRPCMRRACLATMWPRGKDMFVCLLFCCLMKVPACHRLPAESCNHHSRQHGDAAPCNTRQ